MSFKCGIGILANRVAAIKNLSDINIAVGQILDKALRTASDLQPWPNYFKAKAREFRIVTEFCRIGNIHSALEVGCGNGFTAAMLSAIADEVIAFDLPAKAPMSHSIGINITGELKRRLALDSMRIVGGSVEELPFPNSGFDLVFSAYMLQYVKNKDKALKEIRRVLADDGIAIILVPNFTGRIFAPIAQYEYLLRRSLHYMTHWFIRKDASPDGLLQKEAHDAISARRTLQDHILLRPDGCYKSYLEEVTRSTPYSWKRLFEANGLKIKNTFSTEILPLGILDILGAPASKMIFEKAFYLNMKMGNKPVIKDIGCLSGIVAAKI